MKRTLITVIVFALIGLVSACDDDAPPQGVSVDAAITTKNVTPNQMLSAIKAWEDACKPLTSKYWLDVVSAKATAFDELADYRIDGYGWKTTIKIQVKLNENPKHIPNSYNAAGHTLWYFVGAGTKPGMLAQKAQSAVLCGMVPDAKGSDVFKSVPGMATLDAAK
ncbi:MAG: hypothetical protein JXQ84_01905 [Rhodospirillaceae bacterium]|nr:hypothetical protein [Rhodospirillaceae bacterium]